MNEHLVILVEDLDDEKVYLIFSAKFSRVLTRMIIYASLSVMGGCPEKSSILNIVIKSKI